jgi:hypothetical protein
MTDWNAISAFMRAVVPWPGSEQDPGYINVHYRSQKFKGVSGFPTRTSDQFNGFVKWLQAKAPQITDIWFCTSLQAKKSLRKNGKDRAERKSNDALRLKAIWIDCDVKAGDDKHYGTEREALAALLAFQSKVGLPTPSAIVHSGGGFHLYWVSKTPLLPHEWEPFAQGLKQLLINKGIKCDTGLTTDRARILRVPETLNYKYDPPAPVRLLTPSIIQYDFANLDFLKQYAGKPTVSGAKQKLDPTPIFKRCGFLRDALLTGGKDYDQTL